MTHKEPLLEQRFRECLKGFPEFKPEDEVFAIRDDDSLLCGYNTNWEQQGKPEPIAGFDLEIVGKRCYILWLCIRADERKKGHGRTIVGCIDNFARSLDCEDMFVSPSGQGKIFWPKMGFHEVEARTPDSRSFAAIKKLIVFV